VVVAAAAAAAGVQSLLNVWQKDHLCFTTDEYLHPVRIVPASKGTLQAHVRLSVRPCGKNYYQLREVGSIERARSRVISAGFHEISIGHARAKILIRKYNGRRTAKAWRRDKDGIWQSPSVGVKRKTPGRLLLFPPPSAMMNSAQKTARPVTVRRSLTLLIRRQSRRKLIKTIDFINVAEMTKD